MTFQSTMKQESKEKVSKSLTDIDVSKDLKRISFMIPKDMYLRYIRRRYHAVGTLGTVLEERSIMPYLNTTNMLHNTKIIEGMTMHIGPRP